MLPADKMLPAEERGVRRAIAFAELLQHPNLVRMLGTWETDETIFVGECWKRWCWSQGVHKYAFEGQFPDVVGLSLQQQRP
jgi:hypothetical protein